MEELLRRHSPPITPETTGEPHLHIELRRDSTNPQKLDLHGKTVEEAKTRLGWFIDECRRRHVLRAQIITGHGRHSPLGYSVLFLAVKHHLQSLQKSGTVKTVTPHDGSFDIIFEL